MNNMNGVKGVLRSNRNRLPGDKFWGRSTQGECILILILALFILCCQMTTERPATSWPGASTLLGRTSATSSASLTSLSLASSSISPVPT